MNKKVSIVVPIYNGEKYIDKCARNLMNQTYSNVEFILVNDGSTDATAEKCNHYADMDSRFVVLHKENGGVSSSRNAGTDIATGDYILYYDVDDDISENLIEDNIKLAHVNDADVVIFCFCYFNLDTNSRTENKLSSGFVGDKKDFFYGPLNETIDHEVFHAPWNKMYKLSFIKENNLSFIEGVSVYEDIIFNCKMLMHANRIVINNEMYYTYYVRSFGSAITKYVDRYFDFVTKFYSTALDYCSEFENNEEQIQKFTNVYVVLVYTNLKQISCNKELSFAQKNTLIESICNNETFRKAVIKSQLKEPRKKIIRKLILAKSTAAIISIYYVKGCLK